MEKNIKTPDTINICGEEIPKILCKTYEEMKFEVQDMLLKKAMHPILKNDPDLKKRFDSACLWIVGAPGVGKTALIQEVANELNIPFRPTTASSIQEGDLAGMPYAHEDKQTGKVEVDYFYNKKLYPDIPTCIEEMDPKNPNYKKDYCSQGIMFIDEFANLKPNVRGEVLEFIDGQNKSVFTETTFLPQKFPPNWILIVASNNGNAIDETTNPEMAKQITDKFIKFYLYSDYDSHKNYMIQHNYSPFIIGYLAEHPNDVLTSNDDEDMTGKNASPRSWSDVNFDLDIIETCRTAYENTYQKLNDVGKKLLTPNYIKKKLADFQAHCINNLGSAVGGRFYSYYAVVDGTIEPVDYLTTDLAKTKKYPPNMNFSSKIASATRALNYIGTYMNELSNENTTDEEKPTKKRKKISDTGSNKKDLFNKLFKNFQKNTNLLLSKQKDLFDVFISIVASRYSEYLDINELDPEFRENLNLALYMKN